MKKQACSLNYLRAACSWPLNPGVLAVIGLIPSGTRYRFCLGSYITYPTEQELAQYPFIKLKYAC